MSEAVGSAQGEGHPVDIHLPATFLYPMGGIVARVLVGIALLAIAVAWLQLGGVVAILFAVLVVVPGAIILVDNLLALLSPARRAIHLSPDAIAIHYGRTRRSYRFADYAEFRIGRVGLRDMLTALPLDVALGSASVLLKPAVISPMPPFGGNAPASLADWESLLKTLRAAAVSTAGQKVSRIHLVDRTVA